MDANLTFSIKGKSFIIDTHLKKENETGWKFEQSNLSRFFCANNKDTEVLDVQKLAKNFVSLEKNIPYNLQVILVNRDELIYITSNDVRVIPFVFKNDPGTSHLISGSLLQNFRYVTDLSNEIVLANTLPEEQINAHLLLEFITNNISEALTFEGLTVFGGERVWSGWIDLFSIINLLLKSGGISGYYSFDSYAIWEYMLLNLDKDERISNIDKQIFVPDLTFINNSRASDSVSTKSIKIVKGQKSKNLHILEQTFSFFDLGEDGFEIDVNKYYLSRYVLIKNKEDCEISRKIFFKQRYLFQSSCGKNRQISYRQAEYFDEDLRTVLCKSVYPIVSWPKIGSKIYENGTLMDVGVSVHKYINIPVQSELCVSEGQLIVNGDILYKIKKGSRAKIVTSEYAGKVSFTLIDKGILVINSDVKNTSIASLWEGRIISSIKPDSIYIELDAVTFPINNILKNNFGGIFTEWQGDPMVYLQNTSLQIILYIRSSGKAEFSDLAFETGQISGVIINNPALVTKQMLAQLKMINVPYVFIEPASKNLNPMNERMLHQCLGKYVEVQKNEIVIPKINLKNVEKLEMTINDRCGSYKGTAVKFLNYQSEYLYGKIEKSSKSGTNDLLVNLPDGIFEARPENVILI